MALGLLELRDQAGLPIHRAADWLRVSQSHLWNVEQGRAKLTPQQDADLRTFYLARINERVQRLVASLPADSETPDEKAPPSK
jgi:hypothetical protein